MSLPRVAAVDAGSPADRAGLLPGDEILSINGQVPRDVIQYRLLVDEPDVDLEVRRGGLESYLRAEKAAGEPLGAEVSSALFDRVRTCDNHCEFCFIHQLPKGLRRSLYMKDDDYRLSFLYGNFTTLTRFTEADLERVVTERLSPLFVSIHATDPEVRSRMLRNPRGAVSLRWLRALLDHGIEVHGQVVVCPGVNDGAVLADTMTGILDEFAELATVALVPLGISRFSTEGSLREHTQAQARAVVDLVHQRQESFLATLGRRMAFCADEYYLMAGVPFPDADHYEGFAQHENGIGMATAFAAAFAGDDEAAHGTRPGFFAWVDGAPAAGYRAPRTVPVGTVPLGTGPVGTVPVELGRAPGQRRASAPTASGNRTDTGAGLTQEPPTAAPDATAILTGRYGAEVLGPLVADMPDVRLVVVDNRYFGGNIGVAGLLVGEDLTRVLATQPEGDRYLLPDVCLSAGRFLDGTAVEDLPRSVEVVGADGASLRRALGALRSPLVGAR
jgi:putative radical SAM enzyme (TIGR03279 family)